MQKKLNRFCLILTAVFFTLHLQAQTIENSINLYGANFPQEKIYVHFDKEVYLPGETIWFKAYVFEENLPTERSTNFYSALYDEQGKLISNSVSPLFNATANGHFSIPDTVKTSRLIYRAYTTWMMNFDTSLLFSKTIKLVGNDIKKNSIPAMLTTALHFFPEGGSLIDGIKNTIAFKANYSNGLPFEVEGTLKKQETGEALLLIKSVHNGMGRFDFDIEPGNKYYVEWLDHKGQAQKTWLPQVMQAGVSLKLTIQKEKLFYNVINKTGSDSLHIIMYMYQNVFYKNSVAVAAAEAFTGMVPVSKLPSGVMQVTVFDSRWQPVAERIAFINNNNFSMDALLASIVVSAKKRGKNELEISVADTVPANMSLSISDADFNSVGMDNTIISGLLMNGDIKGYIHEPAFYFTNNVDAELKAKLDLVMLTHGWRRYNWNDMAIQKTPVIKSPADEYLGVYGQVSKELMEKMDNEEKVNLIIKTIDSVNTFYSIRPDKSGLLKQSGLVFYDSAKVYFSFNKNKANNSQIAFSKFNFTYPALYPIADARQLLAPDTAGVTLRPDLSLFQYYSSNNGIKKFNEEKTMQGVVVKASGWRNWKNDPLVKMDERYASGMFSGGAVGYSFDVLHDEKAWTKLDIYNYIRSNIPGLNIGSFNLASGRSLNFRDKTVLVYIDEHEMTTNDLENLSLSQVAYIKFIPNFAGRGPEDGGTGINPALSVYTRKGDDLIDRRPTEKDLGSVKVAGYSPVKEFYSPDYSQTNDSNGTDARTTLLWMPYLLTNRMNKKIPVVFYNNDFTQRFRIVLEGINDEGKLIHIEKIVQ